jgi:hypothetical protein
MFGKFDSGVILVPEMRRIVRTTIRCIIRWNPLLQGPLLFDISLLPFPIAAPGTALYPGFLVLMPPKKPARGRENDILILYFKLYGKSSITDAGLKSWLENKATLYHQSAGTVTSGIKSVFEEINADLLDRNSRFAKQNGQVTASLKVMVLKKDQLFLAVSGPGNSFFLALKSSDQLTDDENGGRGLGITQSVSVRFNQQVVASGDVLLFACESPEVWTTELMSGAPTLSNEALYRRLFGPGIGSSQGVMIRFKEGDGKVTLLKPHTGDSIIEAPGETATPQGDTQVQSPLAAVEKVRPFTEPVQPPASRPVASMPTETVRPAPVSSRPTTQSITPDAKPHLVLTPKPGRAEVQQAREPQTALDRGSQPTRITPLPSSTEVKTAVGGALRKTAAVKGKTEQWMKNALQKILPGPSDQPLKFPKAVLIFIAIAIPVVIVAIAATLYVRNGRDSLFEGYLAQAEQLSQRADSQSADAALRLASLQESLYWLDKADQYGESDQATQLRNQVQSELDSVQGITRINMIPAVNSSLPSGTSITQLAISGKDLYALDGTTGVVFRFTQSGSEYIRDAAFDCGPNPDNPISAIDKVVDMVPISTNNTYDASLLAVDAKGTLEYCVPEESGYIVNLTAPDMGWVAISSISLNQGKLYVLDVRGNAVYRFEGSGNLFPDAPTLFFDEVIPPLTEAIDIEVVGYELYILRSSGQLVECTYSPLKDMKSTECTDPAQYADSRTGAVVKTTAFSNAVFYQMHMTQAPDSSLYFLDTSGKAIYHFSYARNLQGILYPRLTDGENLDKYSPTAFAVTPTRQVFIAFGSLIYYGQMP